MSIWLPVQVEGVFVAQTITVVRLNVCGPVPSGGTAPVVFTVNRQVVFEGEITPESARRMAKLPEAPDPGAVGQPIWIGEVSVLKPPPFSVGDAPPAVMSCAEIVAQAYLMPLGSVTVPVTVVNPPCAAAEPARKRAAASARRILRMRYSFIEAGAGKPADCELCGRRWECRVAVVENSLAVGSNSKTAKEPLLIRT